MNLNRKIELLEPSVTVNESGQKLPSFISRGLRSADKDNRKGRENYVAYLTVSENRTLFTIRYDAQIAPTWIINHNGKKYEILNIIEETRLQFMQIIARYRDSEQL